MTIENIAIHKTKLGITDGELGLACVPPVTRQCIAKILSGQRAYTETWEERLRKALREVIACRRGAFETWELNACELEFELDDE